MKKIIKYVPAIVILLFALGLSGCNKDAKPTVNYRQQMRLFVEHISAYVKQQDPGFIVIPQNGQQLLTDDGTPNGQLDANYLNAIDGVGREDLFYGYNADDKQTPVADRNEMLPFMDIAKNSGKTVLVTDYCSTPSYMDDSYNQNNSRGYISFAADHRELDDIPALPLKPYDANADTIKQLSDAKNFLYLIDPSSYDTKEAFLVAIENSNYDVIIMDLYYNGTPFTASDIDALKHKQNGGLRKVICYVSIGEAENYRYYWQPFWTSNPPPFIAAEDPDWSGNYYVKYWDPNWQQIIYGNGQSYIKRVMKADFDGVYLDLIDAYEYYEN